jgi:hypothetical protein
MDLSELSTTIRKASLMADFTLMLFGVFNTLRLFSYVPQIIRIACDPNGATSISYSCWAIWIGANSSTAAYALVNVYDPWLFAVNAFNAACCAVVVGLTFWKRRQETRG